MAIWCGETYDASFAAEVAAFGYEAERTGVDVWVLGQGE